jgi:hypothetical protein
MVVTFFSITFPGFPVKLIIHSAVNMDAARLCFSTCVLPAIMSAVFFSCCYSEAESFVFLMWNTAFANCDAEKTGECSIVLTAFPGIYSQRKPTAGRR